VGAHHLTGLALRPPGFAIKPSVLAGGAVHGDAGRPLYHLAVDPDIDTACRGISCKGHVAGTDITPAVAGPEFRGWKPGEVDLRAAQNDLADGRAELVHVNRGNAAAHDRTGRCNHVAGRERGVEADRKCISLLARTEHIA